MLFGFSFLPRNRIRALNPVLRSQPSGCLISIHQCAIYCYIQVLAIIFGVMQVVAIKLQTLLEWMKLNTVEIDYYIANYPYVHYRYLDVANALKSTINQIVTHIIDSLAYSSKHSFHGELHHPGGNSFNTTQINVLCEVKSELEFIRFSLLGLAEKKYTTGSAMLIKIGEMIDKVRMRKRSSSFQINLQAKRASLSRGKQKIIEGENSFKGPTLLKKLNGTDEFQPEELKKIRMKRQIYAEMSQQLQYYSRPPLPSANRQRNRIFSERDRKEGYLYLKPQPYQRISDKSKEGKSAQKEQVNLGKKEIKRYKYLEEYEREAKKQANLKDILENRKYESPQTNQKYKLLPSTQSQSLKEGDQYDPEDPLGEQISNYNSSNNHMEDIKQQLDFDRLLDSNYKGENENKWEEFQKDSIDGEGSNNSEDSLELMKKKEKHLNQTGYFGNIGVTDSKKEWYEYSFSRQ